jgi:hypothetical protein
MGRSILNEPEASTGDHLVKIHYHKYSTRHSISAGTTGTLWRTANFTTTTDNATFLIRGQIWGRAYASDHCGIFCEILDTNNNNVVAGSANQDGSRYQGIGYAGVNNGSSWAKFLLSWHQVYTGLDAGTYRIRIGWASRNGGSERPFEFWNINSADDGRAHQHDSHCEIWELKNSQGLINQNLSVGVW